MLLRDRCKDGLEFDNETNPDGKGAVSILVSTLQYIVFCCIG